MTRNILYSVPNGIVFIYDPNMIIDVPPDTGAGPILYTENCISVWTAHEDDEQVELSISSESEYIKEEIRFSGYIKSDSGKISFNDSNVREIISIDAIKGINKIKVFSNDSFYPTKIKFILN
ncbi:hypothetical protein [Sphingomonas alpina]|uniref:Uncharacterized protein n=1 Tax=Sphingomonas alpina TaxID=653931 RepID=A0A7H0LF15_9SPHN|nr:hypothetical protein [Sphingomonas alpina]QNQ08268.1 hypothetical protein H3Z74_16070 [Sphingomonas alpina]